MPAISIPSPPSIFPIYLLPSLSFRGRHRRQSSESTSTSSTSPSIPPRYLSGSTSHLRCTRCLTDVCLTNQIVSKGFTGRHGRAYLVNPPPESDGGSLRESGTLLNTYIHKPVPRQLATGAHTVSDISCAICGTILGWKYVAAEEEAQRYKVGKYILETKRVCRGVCWEHPENRFTENVNGTELHGEKSTSVVLDDDIEFDSQDEDECEDLFAGVWSPALARKRRRNRATSMTRGLDEEIA